MKTKYHMPQHPMKAEVNEFYKYINGRETLILFDFSVNNCDIQFKHAVYQVFF